MKLILHHLAKDIRAQRWPLLCLFLILVLGLGVDLLEAQADYQLASVAAFVRTTMVLPISGAIIWTALLARLIQSEPVTGEASFWLTRPVPREVYIPSKLLFIALFLVLPWLIPVPLDMLHYGVDAPHVAVIARNSAIWDGYVILALLWMATFTRTMTGFWAVLLGTFLASVVLISVGTLLSLRTFGNNSIFMSSRWALFISILVVGSLVSLILQHSRRKAKGGFKFGVGACIAAALAMLFFPFRLPAAFTEKFVWSSFVASTKFTSVSFSDDWRQHFTWARNPATDEWIARAEFTPTSKNLYGIPVVENVQVFFQSPKSGQVKLSNGISATNPSETQFDFAQAISADLPGYQLENMVGQPGPFPLSLFTFNRVTDKDLIGQTGDLQLSLFGSMRTLVRQAVIPLNGPGVARLPGQLIHVARLPRMPQPFVMDDTNDRPVLGIWTLSYRDDDHFRPSEHYYLLVNPPARTAKRIPANPSYGIEESLSSFSSKSSRHAYLPLRGDEALDQMVLYIYEFKSGDTFDTKLNDPNFTVNPQ